MRYFKVVVADESFMMQIPAISDPKFIVKTLFGEEAEFSEVTKAEYESFESDCVTEAVMKEGEENAESD